MNESRRSEFVRRISSVGLGTREAIQVILGRVVSDLRDEIVRKKFDDEALDQVIAFHDQAEKLWQDSIATNPPIDKEELVTRLKALLETCRAAKLDEFERRLSRGVRLAEEFEQQADDA